MGDSLRGRDVRSIVVFKQRHIGDVLLSTPVFRALRVSFPGACTAAVVNEGTEAMLSGNPDIDRIVVFHRSRRDAGGMARGKEELSLLREIRASRPDLAVQLTEGDRGAILSFLSGARFRLGVSPARPGMFGKASLFTHMCPQPDRYRHAVLRDLDILAEAGIPPADPSLRFVFSSGDRENLERKLYRAGVPGGTPYAIVHPTSRWTFKCWTDEGVAGVAAHLSRKGIVPVVTSGPDPAEVAQADRIAALSGVACASLAGSLTLKELGAALASARLFVGVDSAPMHIAAAVGTPAVALFGPTGAYNWAPWEGIDWGYTADRPAGTRHVGRHIVVQKEDDLLQRGKGEGRRNPGMEEITLAEVAEAVDRILLTEAGR
ncbi:MAG TPA: putative lipopolysaccharide heptosyltransferase III [Candidatus Limnocylindria bacterium]|nr:putative lipopolysaccharide heptosyltransferase III [Candidatus Limnocylindria bacterium]